jgi:hypothetical protein
MTNDLASFLREAFSFMEEMLTEALQHADRQAICVSDMTGYVRQVSKRLNEDPTFNAQVIPTALIIDCCPCPGGD